MSWEHVLRRDLTCVYRARTGAAILAFTLLLVILPVWLLRPPDFFDGFLSVFTLGAVLLILALAVLGRPRQVVAVSAGFTAIFLVASLIDGSTAGFGNLGDQMVEFLGSGLSFMVPLIALLGTYGALVNERTTGSIRFLLGLPNSRADAYLGKLLSRVGVVVGSLGIGIALLALAVIVLEGLDVATRLYLLGLVTIPYAVVFVGVGLWASAQAETDNQAVAMSVGVFALFRAAWPAFQMLFHEGPFGNEPTPLYYWVGRINPINAYVRATTILMAEADRHPLLTTEEAAVAPIASSEAFAVVVVLSWAVLTPLVGYWTFKRRDVL